MHFVAFLNHQNGEHPMSPSLNLRKQEPKQTFQGASPLYMDFDCFHIVSPCQVIQNFII